MWEREGEGEVEDEGCSREGEGEYRKKEKLQHCQQSLPQHFSNRLMGKYLCVSFRLFQLHTSLCSGTTWQSCRCSNWGKASFHGNTGPHLLGNHPKLLLVETPKNHSSEGSNISSLQYSPCMGRNKLQLTRKVRQPSTSGVQLTGCHVPLLSIKPTTFTASSRFSVSSGNGKKRRSHDSHMTTGSGSYDTSISQSMSHRLPHLPGKARPPWLLQCSTPRLGGSGG